MSRRSVKMTAGMPRLGDGVYTIAEAARYAQASPNTIRNWFVGRSDRRGNGRLLEGDFEKVAGDFALSFLDLVESAVVYRLRQLGVTMSTVRRAHGSLSDSLDVQHPFAHSDLYSDGRDIFVHQANELGEKSLSDAVSRQGFFAYVKNLLDHMEYCQTTHLVSRWLVVAGVTIDPGLAFGKPTLVGTGVTTHIVYRQYVANGEDAALVADLYGLSEQQVMESVRFERSIRTSKAA